MSNPNENPKANVTAGQGIFQNIEEVTITGNRITNRAGDFLYQWSNLIALPSGPIGLVNDAALTICISSFMTATAKLFFILGLPALSISITSIGLLIIYAACYVCNKRSQSLGFHFYVRLFLCAVGCVIGGGLLQ